MAGELVGADPARLARAATELEHLRDALAANVPVIMSTMTSYGAGVDLLPLRQAVGRAVDDAAAMRARARLAALWQAQGVHLDAAGLVSIPWSGQALDAAAAKAEAGALATAVAERDPKVAAAELAAIAQDVADNAGNPAFLRDFWAQPQVAASVSALAGVLHTSGMEVLTPASQRILHSFAVSLAAACQPGVLSRAQGGALVAQFTAASARDVWSAAMLLRFGPPGQAYGSAAGGTGADLLAAVTTRVMLARVHGGYVIPSSGLPTGAAGADLVTSALESFDPAQAMLVLDTQNRAAAAQVLAGPDGRRIAASLMTRPVTLHEPLDAQGSFAAMAAPVAYFDGRPLDFAAPLYAMAHPITIPADVIGNFFAVATSATRGTGAAAHEAALAAVNLIDATPSPVGSNAITVPGPVRQALVQTFGRYLPDLAASVNGPPSQPVYLIPGRDQAWVIWCGSGAVSAFLQQICVNRASFALIHGMAGLAMGTSVGLAARGFTPPGLTDPVASFAALYGRISVEAAKAGISHAEQVDLRDQELNAVISLAEDGFGAIPGGTVLTAAQRLLAVSAPLIPQFSTANAANAIAAEHHQQGLDELLASVPLVRGLMQTGALPGPPPPGAFNAHGAPTLAFGNWWRDIGAGETVGGQKLSAWLTRIQVAMGLQQTTYGAG